MHGWKNEPIEERDRQAIARFIYTVKQKPLSDYLELKRRDFELIGQRLDQSKFRELMFTYLSQQEIYSSVQNSGQIRRIDRVSSIPRLVYPDRKKAWFVMDQLLCITMRVLLRM